jgi:hypothetical protein
VAVVNTRRTDALKTLGGTGLVRTIEIPPAITIGLLYISLIVPLALKKPSLSPLWTVLPVAYFAQIYLVYNASKHDWVDPSESDSWPAALFDVASVRFCRLLTPAAVGDPPCLDPECLAVILLQFVA